MSDDLKNRGEPDRKPHLTHRRTRGPLLDQKAFRAKSWNKPFGPWAIRPTL